jgi:hypothetical protein
MRTVNGQTIGDIFKYKDIKYRAISFPTVNTVEGQSAILNNGRPIFVKISITDVEWITKMKSSNGTQSFSVPNTREGWEFIDLLRIFKNKGIQIKVRGRSKKRKENGGNRVDIAAELSDWIAIYIGKKDTNIELKNEMIHALSNIQKLEKQLTEITERFRDTVKKVCSHNQLPWYRRIRKFNL